MQNKTLYMTFKDNTVPPHVFSRWKQSNPSYAVEFSTDEDCIEFLNQHFHSDIAQLFETIPVGMFKADLWRLCKLYVHGGVYADVDLVPYVDMDRELDCHHHTFYSCLSKNIHSVFQAFMVASRPRNPLLLHFLLSFLQNKPYSRSNGPTYDMYQCLAYNIGEKILPDTPYEIKTVKIKIAIKSSLTRTKGVPLYYFPTDLKDYTIRLLPSAVPDRVTFEIRDHTLWATRIDQEAGWDHYHECEICIDSQQSVLLFQECQENPRDPNDLYSFYIEHQGKKIMDSRDRQYVRGSGFLCM